MILTLLIFRLTAEWPVARIGSMENFPEGSSSLRVKMELRPVSVSFTSMSRLASGVPKGTFSWTLTLYSAWLKVGASSLTSLMVMVTAAVELVLGSAPRLRETLVYCLLLLDILNPFCYLRIDILT